MSVPRHVPTLDGARGIAAFLVLVGHSANEGLLPAVLGRGLGQMAVILFFALSGFLMAHLYAHRPFARPDLARYARQRIGRVVPLYLLIVLVSIAFWRGPVWLFEIDAAPEIARHLLLLHGQWTLWTIPVEIHFYLVFVFLWFMTARGRPALGFAVAGALAAILVPILYLADASDALLPFWLHFFLFGSAVGLIWRTHHERLSALAERPWAQWLGAAGLLFCILALPGWRRMAGVPLLPNWLDPITAGAPLVFFACSLLALGPFKLLALKPLRWLGSVSYGVYLLHLPVLYTAIRWAPDAYGPAVFAGVVVVTLLLAWLSFRAFEVPMQGLIGRTPTRQRPATVEAEASAR